MRFFPPFALSGQANLPKQRVTGQYSSDNWGAFTRLTIVILVRSVVFYGLNTFLPLYWIAVLHQSARMGDIALTTLLVASIVGTFIGGQAADRFGRRVVVLIALGMLAPLILVFLLFSTLSSTLALILLLPTGMAIAAPFSVMVLMGQEYLPHHVGTASGVTLGLAVTVGGITVPLFGHLADLYNLHTALLVLALLPLIAVVCAFTLPGSQHGISVTRA